MKRTLCLIAVLLAPALANSTLVLSISPNLGEAKYKELYQPLADNLTTLLQEEVILDYSGDWLTFSKRMRRGDFDIVIDGPHFVAWRLFPINLGHRGLVQLSGEDRFSLIKLTDTKGSTLKDFDNKVICSRNSPALETVHFLSRFTNPVLQPQVHQITTPKQGLKALRNKRCDALVLRQDQIPAGEEFSVVAESPAFPRPAVSVRENVPASVQNLLIDFFVGSEEWASKLGATWNYQDELEIQAFDGDRYADMDLLSAKVWGW